MFKFGKALFNHCKMPNDHGPLIRSLVKEITAVNKSANRPSTIFNQLANRHFASVHRPAVSHFAAVHRPAVSHFASVDKLANRHFTTVNKPPSNSAIDTNEQPNHQLTDYNLSVDINVGEQPTESKPVYTAAEILQVIKVQKRINTLQSATNLGIIYYCYKVKSSNNHSTLDFTLDSVPIETLLSVTKAMLDLHDCLIYLGYNNLFIIPIINEISLFWLKTTYKNRYAADEASVVCIIITILMTAYYTYHLYDKLNLIGNGRVDGVDADGNLIKKTFVD